jgi:hypothetical protein
MKRLKLILVSLVILLGGCATTTTSDVKVTSVKPPLTLSEEEKWKLMVGKWFGSQPTKEGGIKKEIVERSPQGTYKITFRVYDKEGNYKEEVEAGHWGICGPVYFSIFRGWIKDSQFVSANPADPYNYDAYKIISLTNEVFEYEHFGDGERYVIKKVPIEYEFSE